MRKLNDLIKRARLAKVHALVISHLKKQMPMIGKDSKKKEMIKKLDQIFATLETEHKIPKADFPPVDTMREQLEKWDFTKFHHLDIKMLQKIDKMLEVDIPKLMSLIPHEEREKQSDGKAAVTGGVFTKVLFYKSFLMVILLSRSCYLEELVSMKVLVRLAGSWQETSRSMMRSSTVWRYSQARWWPGLPSRR